MASIVSLRAGSSPIIFGRPKRRWYSSLRSTYLVRMRWRSMARRDSLSSTTRMSLTVRDYRAGRAGGSGLADPARERSGPASLVLEVGQRLARGRRLAPGRVQGVLRLPQGPVEGLQPVGVL